MVGVCRAPLARGRSPQRMLRLAVALLQLSAVVARVALTLSTACALGGPAIDQLRCESISHVVLDAPLSMEAEVPAALGAVMQAGGWVHAGATIKELAAARRAGAATIWFNEVAAKTAIGDVEAHGYLGASIIEDFADAVCGSAEELASATVDAWRVFEERAEEEDSLAERGGPVDITSWIEESIVQDNEAAALPQGAGGTGAAPASTKFCISCGVRLPSTARFCSECGERVL